MYGDPALCFEHRIQPYQDVEACEYVDHEALIDCCRPDDGQCRGDDDFIDPWPANCFPRPDFMDP